MQRIYLCLTFPWFSRPRRAAVGTPTPSLYILGGRPLLSLALALSQGHRRPSSPKSGFPEGSHEPTQPAQQLLFKDRLPQELEVLGLKASLGLEAIFDFPLRQLSRSPVGPPA